MSLSEGSVDGDDAMSHNIATRYYRLLLKNSLFKNSINLMLSAGVTALFGFVFWTIVARSFRPETVGLATTLLSMCSLLSLLGLAGFDTIFVRFLPKSNQRNEHINNGLIVSGIASAILAFGFCLLISLLSPKLSFVNSSIWFQLSFIIFTIFTTWNILTNAILIAYRRTSFVVIINIIFSAFKMVLPFLISSGGPMTIFTFTGLAQVLNVVLSVGALMYFYNYKPALRLHFGILKEMSRYGSAVYVGQVLNLLPDSFLPLIVVNKLGASAAAYFYIAMTIANLLYTVSFSTAQALLAEVANDELHLIDHLKKGLKFSALLTLPLVILIIIFSPYILTLFGEMYKSGATSVLRLLSIAGLGVMAGALINVYFKQTRKLKPMLITTASNSLATVILSYVLIDVFGLNGIGWAFIIGGCISLVIGAYYVYDSVIVKM